VGSSVVTQYWPAGQPTPPVGYVRAASYGWTLGGAVGLAMVSGGGELVTRDWLKAGTWEVDIAGARHPVEVSLRPMYDPASARIKV
jgi:glycine cleavage system aminomethyltransferase T